jgi:hypothetical protein
LFFDGGYAELRRFCQGLMVCNALRQALRALQLNISPQLSIKAQ